MYISICPVKFSRSEWHLSKCTSRETDKDSIDLRTRFTEKSTTNINKHQRRKTHSMRPRAVACANGVYFLSMHAELATHVIHCQWLLFARTFHVVSVYVYNGSRGVISDPVCVMGERYSRCRNLRPRSAETARSFLSFPISRWKDSKSQKKLTLWISIRLTLLNIT